MPTFEPRPRSYRKTLSGRVVQVHNPSKASESGDQAEASSSNKSDVGYESEDPDVNEPSSSDLKPQPPPSPRLTDNKEVFEAMPPLKTNQEIMTAMPKRQADPPKDWKHDKTPSDMADVLTAKLKEAKQERKEEDAEDARRTDAGLQILPRQRARSRSSGSSGPSGGSGRRIGVPSGPKTDNDAVEEMTDDPVIARYAEQFDGTSWGLGHLSINKR